MANKDIKRIDCITLLNGKKSARIFISQDLWEFCVDDEWFCANKNLTSQNFSKIKERKYLLANDIRKFMYTENVERVSVRPLGEQ